MLNFHAESLKFIIDENSFLQPIQNLFFSIFSIGLFL